MSTVPSYYAKILSEKSATPSNGHVVDPSKITPEYALQQVGRDGLHGIERESKTPAELMYRGGQAVANLLFSRWVLPDRTQVTMGTSRLVEMLATKGRLTDAEKTALATHFGENEVSLPYAPGKFISAKHPLKPAENVKNGSIQPAPVPDLEVYVLTK